MNRKVYILSFDKTMNIDELHNVIKILHNQAIIENWWRYLSNSYLLVSNYSAVDLNQKIGQRFSGNKKYLIAEVNLNNYNGWLSNEAWEWVKKYKYDLGFFY